MIFRSILAWRALILGFRILKLQHWTQNEILDQVPFFRAPKLNIWARLARKQLFFERFFREISRFSNFLRRNVNIYLMMIFCVFWNPKMKPQSIWAWRALILRSGIWKLEHWTQNEILDQVRFFRALKFDIWARLARKLLVFVRFFREISSFFNLFLILWSFKNSSFFAFFQTHPKSILNRHLAPLAAPNRFFMILG